MDWNELERLEKAATKGPFVTDGYNVWGPLDARSNHTSGRMLVGGVVDDLNDWRAWPAQSPDERATFRAEREANAGLFVALRNAFPEIAALRAENARLRGALERCIETMEMQLRRERDEVHIPASAAMPIYAGAIAAARALVRKEGT